ncbi:MAG: pyridoxamine 5'-phosphate oxidase family protein [Actinomycetes bacterium]
MRWQEFMAACPEFGQLADARFRGDQLVLLGTVSRDGWPRISPCEVDIAAGELFLGMMWQSKKALDLLRDPRLLVHSVPSDKDNPGGDIKLYGRAVDITDPELRGAFRDAILARIDWAPDEPEFHLFALDVDRAAYLRFGGGMTLWQWDAEHGLRQEERPHG